jgi:hypothetical protein
MSINFLSFSFKKRLLYQIVAKVFTTWSPFCGLLYFLCTLQCFEIYYIDYVIFMACQIYILYILLMG